MLQYAPAATADAFLASRFDPDWGMALGVCAGTGEAARLIELA